MGEPGFKLDLTEDGQVFSIYRQSPSRCYSDFIVSHHSSMRKVEPHCAVGVELEVVAWSCGGSQGVIMHTTITHVREEINTFKSESITK